MGVARDVFEILDTAFVDFSDTMKDRFDDINSIQASSISRKAADGTLQFPVLMSRSINFENAQRVTKAIESKCASFAEIVMTMNPNMDTYGHNGASEYVRQFHSNIDTEDDPFDAVSNFVNSKESYDIQTQVYTAGSYDYRALKEDLKEFGCDWRENKLNDVVEAKYVKDNQFVVPLRGSQLQELVKEKLRAIKEAASYSYAAFIDKTSGDTFFVKYDEKDEKFNYDTTEFDYLPITQKDYEDHLYTSGGTTSQTPGLYVVQPGDDEVRSAFVSSRSEEVSPTERFRARTSGKQLAARLARQRDEHEADNALKLQLQQNQIDAMNANAKAQRDLLERQAKERADLQKKLAEDNRLSQEQRDEKMREFEEKQAKERQDFQEKQMKAEHEFRRKEAKKERKFREKMAARPDRVAFQDILMNNEVKKSNELQPILLHIRVIAKEEKMYTDFVIGVKATMHPINSEEMVNELVEACRFHSEVFRFIRWTTGEISFLTDILLNMKDSKRAISRQSNGGSPWWNRLHKMSVIAKFKKATFMKKRILPNATIVCSQQEVDYIKSTYGFDLMKPNFIEDIMSKYFLLCFAVLDDSLEVVHFKFDGQRSYETLSFSGLEKENSNAARNFRDILKAVQHV